MLLGSLAALALVVQDPAALRAAPRDAAPQQAVLSPGDTLEVRGSRMDYLQVYDHRRERGGYVRATQVRSVSLEADAAAGLLAVVRFLRDTPGQEALGIAYAAAYLKAVPAPALDAEPFDAIGGMAERLAQRASSRRSPAEEARIAAQLDTVAEYGIRFASLEREQHMQLCYDGEAYRRVLAMTASAELQARAALGLTRHECVDPALNPLTRAALDQWRSEVLDRVDIGQLSPLMRNRLHLRRAGVWAAIAFERSRRAEDPHAAASRALQELAAVDQGELSDADHEGYTEAAVRTAASQWAALPAVGAATRLTVLTQPGPEPGQTCVQLVDAQRKATAPLLQRCSYGTVWATSVVANAAGTALALAVQPLAGWRELWMFHLTDAGWIVDVLPPADTEPGLGYVDFAGWVPGGKQFLAAREARVDGRWQRSFEVLSINTLLTDKRADAPEHLSAFYRWQSPLWKQQTLSLR